MVVVILEPESEGFVKLLQGHPLLESREEPFSNGPKQTLHLSSRGTVIRFGVDEGDPGLGTASRQ